MLSGITYKFICNRHYFMWPGCRCRHQQHHHHHRRLSLSCQNTPPTINYSTQRGKLEHCEWTATPKWIRTRQLSNHIWQERDFCGRTSSAAASYNAASYTHTRRDSLARDNESAQNQHFIHSARIRIKGTHRQRGVGVRRLPTTANNHHHHHHHHQRMHILKVCVLFFSFADESMTLNNIRPHSIPVLMRTFSKLRLIKMLKIELYNNSA